MSKNIKIDLDHGSLRRGGTVPVHVKINFDGPTKVRGIRAHLHGYEKTSANYTTTERNSKGETRTVTKTATEYVDIVNEEFLLFGEPRKGFFSRLGDSAATWVGGGDHEVIDAGEQEFTFEAAIPPHALATFKGQKCEVTYRVTVAVDLPIKIDWEHSIDLEIPPEAMELTDTEPVHVVFPDDTGRSFWDKTFGKDVRINVAVDRDTLTIGETALAMLTLETPEPLKVKTIKVTLLGTERSVAQTHRDSHEYRLPICEVETPSMITNESAHEFEILVPELNAPFSQSGTNFDVSWAIEVRLHIPWAKDPVIVAPIQILPSHAKQ